MAWFTWSDDYSVHVQDIDRQHQGLFYVLNELHKAMLAGEGAERLTAVLSSLVTYVRDHFSAEETLMLQASYPEYDAHKAEHHEFARRVSELLDKQRRGSKSQVTIEVLQMLRDWLTTHIKGTDQKYAPYVAKLWDVSTMS
jgi:hemerythrin